jgi:hypothetical protein
VRLLAVNLWDKYAEARRWVAEAARWLPDWRVRLDCNGDPGGPLGAETRLFPNRGGILGTYDSYGFVVPAGCDAVASVHAKCWLSDPSVIDRIADRMLAEGAGAAIVTSPHFHHGMSLHLFMAAADLWTPLVDAIDRDVALFPEESVRRAIERTCGRVLEVPTGMWQDLPDRAAPNFNGDGGRHSNGYQVSHLNGEVGTRLVSTEIRDHPARRR